MAFANQYRPGMGKSLADRMRDCIAEGMSETQAVERVRQQVSTKRTSKRRLASLYQSLLPNK